MKCPYVPIKFKKKIFQEKFLNKDNNASFFINSVNFFENEDDSEILINELITKKKKLFNSLEVKKIGNYNYPNIAKFTELKKEINNYKNDIFLSQISDIELSLKKFKNDLSFSSINNFDYISKLTLKNLDSQKEKIKSIILNSKINILENIEFKSLKPEEKKKIDEYIKKHKKIEEEKNNLNNKEEKEKEKFNHEIENNYEKEEIEEKEDNSEDLNLINLDDEKNGFEKKNSNEDSDSLEDKQLKEFINNDDQDNNSKNNDNAHSDNYDNKMEDIKIKFIYENNPKYNETEYFKYEDDPNLMSVRVFEKHYDILNIKLYYMNGEEIIIDPNNDLCIGEFMKGKNKILIKN